MDTSIKICKYIFARKEALVEPGNFKCSQELFQAFFLDPENGGILNLERSFLKLIIHLKILFVQINKDFRFREKLTVILFYMIFQHILHLIKV